MHDDAIKTAVRAAKTPEDAMDVSSLSIAAQSIKDVLAKEAADAKAAAPDATETVGGTLLSSGLVPSKVSATA